jgi:hypothetical protein
MTVNIPNNNSKLLMKLMSSNFGTVVTLPLHLIVIPLYHDDVCSPSIYSPCWQVAATAHSAISTHVQGLGWSDRNLVVCSDAVRKLAASSTSAITKHTSHSEPVNVRMNTSCVSGNPAALYASMRLDINGKLFAGVNTVSK